MSHKILVPTDLSDAAIPALELALALAGPLELSVQLLYVIDTHRNQLEPLPTSYELESEAWVRQMRAQADHALRKLANPGSQSIALEFTTTMGDPREEILALSRREPVEMIVMATRGRGALHDLFVGSVALGVIRSAPCAVLTVKTGRPVTLGARQELDTDEVDSSLIQDRAPRRILAAIDLTEASLPALQKASQLAEKLSAQLTVLYVADIGYGTLPLLVNVDAQDLPERLGRSAGEALGVFLRGHADQLDSRILTAPRLVPVGEAAREIEVAVLQNDADLVVLGRHGRSGFRKLWMGSIAEQVVRQAPCPVMTVPRTQTEE